MKEIVLQQDAYSDYRYEGLETDTEYDPTRFPDPVQLQTQLGVS